MNNEVEGLLGIKISIREGRWNVWTVYNNRCIEKIAKKLKENTENIRDEVLIIGGDMNARIGLEGTVYRGELDDAQMERKSKDRVKNREGEKMFELIEERGWLILNGNMQGDEKGELTRIEKRGASVVDYVFANSKGWDKTSKFFIKDRIASDHQSLIL